MTDDVELLRRYAEERSEEAFADLVQRHLGLVYHAAHRQLGGDVHRARDVAQSVFTDLARKAAQVSGHASVVGWLHTSTRYAAAQVRRAEARRKTREQVAHVMEESGGSVEWERLRPVIDEAIGTLSERDREAVLLRFFEDRPFAEIGEKFFTTEDAARVRVNRALEKLQAVLAQQGVTSTTAALAIALEAQAAATVPTGLAAFVTGAALAVAPASGVGSALVAFMTTTKFMAAAAGAVALLAIGTAIYQTHRANGLEAVTVEAQRDAAELRSRLGQLETRLDTEIKRAHAADEDNARLIEAMDRLAELKIEDAAKAEVRVVTEADVDRRHRRARELAASGQHAKALEEYLWCFDDGMTRFPRYYGVRTSFLIAEMSELADKYPPAREALRTRRDAAAVRMRDNPSDATAVAEWVTLNEAFYDRAKTLAYFAELPEGDPRRQALGSRLVGSFVEEKRYAEAVEFDDYARQRGMLELSIANFAQVATGEQKEAIRRTIVQATATGVEALAGAGEIQQSRELAWRLLEFDSSEATRRLLQEHAARAGVPDLLVGSSTTVGPGR